MNQITFTPELLAKLKDEYRKAKDAGLPEFKFEGHTLLVEYAKYLIEYLDIQFKEPKRLHFTHQEVEMRQQSMSRGVEAHPSVELAIRKTKKTPHQLAPLWEDYLVYALMLEETARKVAPSVDLKTICNEVYKEFGTWWIKQIMFHCEPGTIPTRDICSTELRVLMTVYFAQGKVTEEVLVEHFHTIDIPSMGE